MSLFRLVLALVLTVCCWLVTATADDTKPTVHPTSAGPVKNTTALNSTDSGGKKGGKEEEKPPLGPGGVTSSMIQRALYVLIGITLIGLLYFLVRAVRVKKPALKKKYGLLSNYDDSVEMEGVESDEDDTLYEARGLRR